MTCAPRPHPGFARLSTSIPNSHSRWGPQDSIARPRQLDPCSRNLDCVINKKHASLGQRALLNTAIEETKSRCGGRMSGDVIAKSTNARTPEIHSLKVVNDRLKSIFQAMESLSVVGVVKEGVTYRYE